MTSARVSQCHGVAIVLTVVTRQESVRHHPLVGVVEHAGQDYLTPGTPFGRSLESVADYPN